MCNLNPHSNVLTNSCAACKNKCASTQPSQAEMQPSAPPLELDGLSALQLALSRTLRLIESSRLRSISLDD
jgi:hypothetical protein